VNLGCDEKRLTLERWHSLFGLMLDPLGWLYGSERQAGKKEEFSESLVGISIDSQVVG
jgi:hypothetical protein